MQAFANNSVGSGCFTTAGGLVVTLVLVFFSPLQLRGEDTVIGPFKGSEDTTT